MATKPDPAQDARDKFAGRCVEYEIEGHGPVIFRRPTKGEMDRFIDQVSDDKVNKSQAMSVLVAACRAYPDPEGYRAAINDFPGFVLTVVADLQEMASGSGGAIAKKG